MENSKIYAVLLHFNRIEQNRLRKYIVSPYFNKNEALIQLFESLVKQINKDNGKELTKQQLWAQLYPEKEFDDVRYRKLCSDLLKLVEGFLAQETFEENSMQKANFLMEAVTRRKLEKLYSTCIITSNRLSKAYPFRAADYFHHQYKFEDRRYQLEFELNRSSKSNVESIIKNLDVFYLSEKLKRTCDILTRKTFMSSHEYDNLFIEEIVNYLNENPTDEFPPVAIYYQIYLTLIESDKEEHYYKLKELLSKYGEFFPSNEAKEIYEASLNYCIRKVNRGNIDFLKELFDLHETLVINGLMFVDGELSPWNFKNIVFTALRLKKFNWTDEFIQKYKHQLPDVFRDSAVSFNTARLRFYQKNYDEVIFLLNQVEYEDVSYNLGSKSILLLTYYETDEIEPLYSLMDSFRAFLRRKKDKIPQKRIDNYLQLINFVKKLTKIKPGDTKAITQLKAEVKNTKGVADEKWLLEKIAELE